MSKSSVANLESAANLTNEELAELREKVAKITEGKDPNELSKKENESIKADGQPIGIIEMIHRMSSPCEKSAYWIAVIFAVLTGGVGPLIAIAFGGIIDTVGDGAGVTAEEAAELLRQQAKEAEDKNWEATKASSFRFVIAASYTWVTFAVMIFGLNYVVEKVAYKIRILYFKRSLEKDAAYYDLHNPTEMAAKISKEVSLIAAGGGQKFGNVIQGFSNVAIGIFGAFFYGW